MDLAGERDDAVLEERFADDVSDVRARGAAIGEELRGAG